MPDIRFANWHCSAQSCRSPSRGMIRANRVSPLRNLDPLPRNPLIFCRVDDTKPGSTAPCPQTGVGMPRLIGTAGLIRNASANGPWLTNPRSLRSPLGRAVARRARRIAQRTWQPKPSASRLSVILASSRTLSVCCSRISATSLSIFSSNGSPSSSWGWKPT